MLEDYLAANAPNVMEHTQLEVLDPIDEHLGAVRELVLQVVKDKTPFKDLAPFIEATCHKAPIN